MAWRNHIFEILGNHLGFQLSLADPKVRFKAETDKSRNEYFTHILFYIHDLLIVDKDPQKYMAMLESNYTVEPSSIVEPKDNLGANVVKLLYKYVFYS